MAAQINILNDVGTLLRLPSKVSNELTDKACLCIGSAIAEAKRRGDTQITINIGIGTLSVDLIDMQCKFIPSKSLKAAIKRGVTEKIDPLEFELEQALIAKLCNICDEEI